MIDLPEVSELFNEFLLVLKLSTYERYDYIDLLIEVYSFLLNYNFV